MTKFFIFYFLKKILSMEDIIKKCSSIIDLSKFTFNKNILSEIIVIDYN